MATTVEKQNTPKLVKATARDLRISPRKMRLVTNAVKGKQVGDAAVMLRFMNKKGAPMVLKLLKSAIANAEHNFSLDPDQLFIKSITCDMGKVMSRYFPRARGSAFIIRRKMAHVNLVLEARPQAKKTRSRFGSIRAAKQPGVKEQTVPQEDTRGHEAAAETPLQQKRVKTTEQVKANKVTQKRRLFNRKGGE